MKQFTLFFFAFFSLLIMMSCKDDVSKQLDNNKQTMTEEKGLICFPKLALQGSRSEQDANDWENWSKVLLASGEEAFTPWNSVTGTDIPYDVRTDIKKADGWELIFQIMYLQLIIPQYFISNKSGIWSLSLIVHSKG